MTCDSDDVNVYVHVQIRHMRILGAPDPKANQLFLYEYILCMYTYVNDLYYT